MEREEEEEEGKKEVGGERREAEGEDILTVPWILSISYEQGRKHWV